jgi:hypothetical protein
LPFASAIAALVAVNGPVFSYEASGNVTDSASPGWEAPVTFSYDMSMARACLTASTIARHPLRYIGIDCFPVDCPRRLTLSPFLEASSTTAGDDDFSTAVLASVAPIIQEARATAVLNAVCVVVGFLVFAGGALCNGRREMLRGGLRCGAKAPASS